MEQVANAIGRAFKDDFGPLGIRNRLQHTGRVGIGMGPEGHLRAVEELNGAGPPNPLRSRCADLVAAVQLVEEQLLRIRRARRWADELRAMLEIGRAAGRERVCTYV